MFAGGAVVKRRSIETFISEVLKGKVGVQVLYGMTEIGIVTTWRNKNLLVHSKADSSGYLAPGAEVKVDKYIGTVPDEEKPDILNIYYCKGFFFGLGGSMFILFY